ncbi:hypothetical protein KSP40_PGU017618 [Platanthera guangdongensis]|uniref:Glucan endo-1,3-beta-D-glucosidase n=1 Tax=Platanthera guangdongensis TaxID=2320717 RepID=A0ABR2M6I3_9ASPA
MRANYGMKGDNLPTPPQVISLCRSKNITRLRLFDPNAAALVVSETGWPSAGGGNASTVDNARAYNNNLISHVNEKTGMPKRPGNDLEVDIFALFNENLKPEGTEQNFGIFYADMTEEKAAA